MGQTLHNQRIRELRCRHMDTQTHTPRHTHTDTQLITIPATSIQRRARGLCTNDVTNKHRNVSWNFTKRFYACYIGKNSKKI